MALAATGSSVAATNNYCSNTTVSNRGGISCKANLGNKNYYALLPVDSRCTAGKCNTSCWNLYLVALLDGWNSTNKSNIGSWHCDSMRLHNTWRGAGEGDIRCRNCYKIIPARGRSQSTTYNRAIRECAPNARHLVPRRSVYRLPENVWMRWQRSSPTRHHDRVGNAPAHVGIVVIPHRERGLRR